MSIRPSLLGLMLLGGCYTSFAQVDLRAGKGIDYKYEIKSVFNTDNIIYYGWDFSQSKLTDVDKFSDRKIIVERHIPEWMIWLNGHFSAEFMQKKLKFTTVTANFQPVQDLSRKIDANSYVRVSNYEIKIEKLDSIVSTYILPEKTGIGFIFIIESLNKPERFVTGYATFFNIETRKLLWVTKIKEVPGSKYGFADYYRRGFIILWDVYYPNFYRKARRAYKN